MSRLRVADFIGATRSQRGVIARVTVVLALSLASMAPAHAARISDLYAASGTLPTGSREPLNDAFNEALGKVLVRVTGRQDASSPVYLATLFPDPAQVVQQYRRESGGTVWAQFDGAAVRRILDGAGQPLWGADRPLVLIWLAVDSGTGERSILASETDPLEPAVLESGATESDVVLLDEIRVVLEETAETRGIPLLLPLVDAEDLSRITFAEIWGDFGNVVMGASERYGADVIVIGRALTSGVPGRQVRWTLMAGEERIEWEGDIADGPNGAADWIAGRFATYADSAGKIRLSVDGVTSLEDYGAVTRYLKSLSVVEQCDVAHVSGDSVDFDLTVRGDAERLSRAMRSSRLLEPRALTNDPSNDLGMLPGYERRPDLVYTLVASP